jgi:hypothetical protein
LKKRTIRVSLTLIEGDVDMAGVWVTAAVFTPFPVKDSASDFVIMNDITNSFRRVRLRICTNLISQVDTFRFVVCEVCVNVNGTNPALSIRRMI